MPKWMQLVFGQAEMIFDSPYPLHKCRHIIADYDDMGGIRKSVQLVDVYSQPDSSVGFTIQRNLLTNTKVSPSVWTIKGQITGLLTPTETGTRVTYRTKINWMAWLAYSVVFCFIVFLLLSTPSMLINQQTRDIFSIVLWGGVFVSLLGIYPPIRHFRHFVLLPYNLLTDTPLYTPNTMHPNRFFTFHYRFNFYANQTLPVCMKHLSLVITEKHHQLTPLGVLEGSTSEDSFFTGYHKISNDNIYFWITENKQYCLTYRNYIFGQIQVEDNHVQISGYSQQAIPYGYILFLGVVMGFMMLFIPAITPIIGLMGYIQIQISTIQPMKRLGNRVADKIQRETDSPTKQKWFWQARSFDFHSPYPIDDCVNMLFDYSTKLGDYQTDEGRGKGAVVGDLLVILYEKDVQHYQFTILPKSARTNPLENYVRVIGSLQTQGYGTRVQGRLKSQGRMTMVFITISVLVLSIMSVLISPVLFLIGVIITSILEMTHLTKSRWFNILNNYPQDVLGQKANRKQKVADKTTSY